MPTVKAIPEGVQPVFPMLVCRSPEAEMNFCAAVERAIAAGVKILMPAQNQFWGDRTARILDPSGHVWTVASRLEETTEDQRAARWSEIRGS